MKRPFCISFACFNLIVPVIRLQTWMPLKPSKFFFIFVSYRWAFNFYWHEWPCWIWSLLGGRLAVTFFISFKFGQRLYMKLPYTSSLLCRTKMCFSVVYVSVNSFCEDLGLGPWISRPTSEKFAWKKFFKQKEFLKPMKLNILILRPWFYTSRALDIRSLAISSKFTYQGRKM